MPLWIASKVWKVKEQRKRCMDAWRSALAAAKREADKVRREYEPGIVSANKLVTEKNFPEPMRDHFINGLQNLQTKGNELMTSWTEAVKNKKKDQQEEDEGAKK